MEYKTIWNGNGPWKVCPSPSSKFLGWIFYDISMALEICANIQTPNFKSLACAGLQMFDLKCPSEAFRGEIQHFYWSQKSFILKSCPICENSVIWYIKLYNSTIFKKQ